MSFLKNTAKYLIIFLVLAIITMFVLWLVNAPDELAENSASKLRLDRAEYSVDEIDIQIIDATRSTPALGEFNGDSKRVLNGSIWFPHSSKEGNSSRHPLVIYSHGFGGRHRDSTYLVNYLAANGYIVAAIDFPLSHMNTPAGVPQLADVSNQPGDVVKLIDHVLAANTDSNSHLYQKVDVNNIGVMGLSLGGLTSALVAFHPDLKDTRINAAIMMAPPLEAFTEGFFANSPTVNSLLISGSLDRIVPEQANATEIHARHPKGWFISLDKGNHIGFADFGNFTRWMENSDNFGCALIGYHFSRIDLPQQWDEIIPNTGGILQNIDRNDPCPELAGKAINGLTQQWLNSITIGSFFDMHLRSGPISKQATEFFSNQLTSENPEISLVIPGQQN